MALGGDEIELLLQRSRLTDAGKEYVRAVRSSEPARLVQGGKRNVRCRYASQKMHLALETESDLERGVAIATEYNRDVVEMWEQPSRVLVSYKGKAGRTIRQSYVPDFLVIGTNFFELIQVKYEKDCIELVRSNPWRWSTSDGHYSDDAASALCAEMGMRHRVVTEREVPAVLIENLSLLLQSRRCEPSPEDLLNLLSRVQKLLSRMGVATITEIAEQLRIRDLTELLHLIDRGDIFVDLREQRICEPDSCYIAADSSTARALDAIQNDAKIRMIREAVSSERMPSKRGMLEIARRRQELLCPASPNRERTRRRWKKKMREAGGDILALASRSNERGNRTRRIDSEYLALIREAIQAVVLVKNGSGPAAGYRDYKTRHSIHFKGRPDKRPVTFNTFLAELRRIPMEQIAYAQGGRRAGNEVAPPTESKLRSLVPLRAFEKAHIDHYLADHYVVVGTYQGKRRTAKLWITLMVDDATSAVLAISVSLRRPSRLACAAVIRECVRRHGRLPEYIMVDNGSDFQSVYFEVLLARYGVHKLDRPPEDPRFGGKMENTFKTAKTELMESLQGSSRNDKKGRASSPSHKGSRLASWTIDKIYGVYQHYFYNVYNGRVSSRYLSSPLELLTASLQTFSCSGQRFAFDEALIIATAVPTKKPVTVTIRGIRPDQTWFWHPELQRVLGKHVEVLIEPWDKNRVYALVGKKWVACLSGGAGATDYTSTSSKLQSILWLESKTLRAKAKEEYELSLGEMVSSINAGHAVPPSDATVLSPTPTVEKAARERAPQATIVPFEAVEVSWNRKRYDNR